MLKSIKLEMKKEVTVDTTEIQRIIRVYYKQLYNLQNGEPRRNAQILRKVCFPTTKPRINRKYGQTECGPLEKGMANHFSILALRTP